MKPAQGGRAWLHWFPCLIHAQLTYKQMLEARAGLWANGGPAALEPQICRGQTQAHAKGHLPCRLQVRVLLLDLWLTLVALPAELQLYGHGSVRGLW